MQRLRNFGSWCGYHLEVSYHPPDDCCSPGTPVLYVNCTSCFHCLPSLGLCQTTKRLRDFDLVFPVRRKRLLFLFFFLWTATLSVTLCTPDRGLSLACYHQTLHKWFPIGCFSWTGTQKSDCEWLWHTSVPPAVCLNHSASYWTAATFQQTHLVFEKKGDACLDLISLSQ